MSQADMAHAIETELLPGLKSGGLKLGGASQSPQSPASPADRALSYGDRWEQAKAIPGQLMQAADSGLRAINMGIPFSDRMIAGAASLPIIGNGQSYSDNLARERNARAELSQEHPVLAAGGNAVGTAATGAALPLGAAAEGAGLLGKVGYGMMTGGAAGGVQGMSNSPDLTDIGRTAKDAAEGAALGEAFGGAVPVAGAGFNAVRNFFANPEGSIVARALQGVDDATLGRAQALMEDAQRRGITLTSAEAVQQASNGASGLGRLQ
jgi:hypothetical protein